MHGDHAPYQLSLNEAAQAVRARSVSPVELLDSVLARLDATEPEVGAYVGVQRDRAMAGARRAADEAAAGHIRGPLHGVPMAVKDVIDVAGLPTGAGSRVREKHIARADSHVMTLLARAGAVLVGKTQTHEFAYGLITPQTRNARNRSMIAGGSSGGSAVAVALGSATYALGTDTGGSIRVPAALNGVVGLKPTYGLVSRAGVTPLSWSLDHVGPIARTVADVALVLDVIAKPDPSDPSSVPRSPGGYQVRAPADLTGLVVGVASDEDVHPLEPAVGAAAHAVVQRLERLGATPVEVRLPMRQHLQAMQWGLLVPEATAVHETSLRTSAERYGDDVRVLLEAGLLVPAGDHLRALRARRRFAREWAVMMDGLDVLLMPTVPTTAVPIGTDSVSWSSGSVEAVADAYIRLSMPANLSGSPALTLPVGHDDDALPVGVQLIAAPGDDARLLSVAAAVETALDISTRPD